MVGIEERSERRPLVGGRDQQLVVAEVVALRRPVAPARLQQPQPADVLQQPRRAAHAALVGEVQLARARRDDRRGSSVPSSDQVPELRNARARRRDTDATAEPCRGTPARRPACRRARGDASAADAPSDRAGLDERRQQPRRQVELLEQIASPTSASARRRTASSSRCVLGTQLAGQPVVQQIGNRDEARCAASMQPRRRAAGRVELIQRVERQELDAGDRVDRARAGRARTPPPSRRRCARRDSDTGSRADCRCSPRSA